jgi:hypothetical protein
MLLESNRICVSPSREDVMGVRLLGSVEVIVRVSVLMMTSPLPPPSRLEASCPTRSDGVRAQAVEMSNLVQVRQGKLSPAMVIVTAGVVIQVCERRVVAKVWVPASWEVHASQRIVVDAGQ